MLLEIVIVALIGILVGGIVNLLADELPYRRSPQLPPVYPDGSPRPPIAWLGLTAYLTGKRQAENPLPPIPYDPEERDEDGYLKRPIDVIRETPDTRTRLYREKPRLSWRYPATEILTAALMLLALNAAQAQSIPFGQFVFWLIYMAIFALVIVIDVEHKLILFVVMIPSAIIALLDAVLFPMTGPNIPDALGGAVLGFVIFYLLYLGGFLFTYVMGQARGQKISTVAFGYGDVMLITLSGLMLGFSDTILAIFIAVFLGAFGAFAYLIGRALVGGRYSAFTALPYGPYIVVATLVMLLYSEPVSRALLGY